VVPTMLGEIIEGTAANTIFKTSSDVETKFY